VEKSDLLHQLRIDRSAPAAGSRGTGVWVGIVVGVLVLAALGAAAWWLLRGGEIFAVGTAVAAAPAGGGAGSTAVLQATGYVTARREATVSAQITGTILDEHVEEGEHVELGQVLAHLDSTAQVAALAQASAQLQVAQATLAQFQAQLAQSRRDLVRAEDLVGRKLVSLQSVEVARTQVETQLSQLESQRRQVELARAGVQGAQVQLDYCTVHAPFKGVIIAKSAQVGEIVSPFSAGGGFTRTGIGTIVDMDSLEVEVDVNESYINRVVAGQPTEAVLDAYQDWRIPGHVIAIIPTADRSKATVKVRVALDQKDPRIVPDMGVRVSFLEEAAKSGGQAPPPPKGVLVPGDSVVQHDGKSAVYVVDGEKARLRSVTAGQTYADLRLVEGIAIGTRVVRAPPAGMTDGARVEIKNAAK
jgi:RND family efflux transporter MFP subunit